MKSQSRLILFLDFDDVICLNEEVGGYDALSAFSEASQTGVPVSQRDELWSILFNRKACDNLRQAHEEFSLSYVLSTSWRWFFDRDALEQTLHLSGLSFIAENLHSDWSTPQTARSAHRAVEVKGWLSEHPECANAWVVLDDELSGTGFLMWPRQMQKFVVLCQAGVGLQKTELQRLKQSLSIRQLLLK